MEAGPSDPRPRYASVKWWSLAMSVVTYSGHVKGVNKCPLCFALRSFLICLMLLIKMEECGTASLGNMSIHGKPLGTKVPNYSISTAGYISASRILILLIVTKQDNINKF
jgi:hypothetical protein